MRKIFIILIFLLSLSIPAYSQQLADYLFLEVVDSAEKPVAEAKIVSDKNPKIKTDGQGKARFYFSSFTVSKTGFFPFQDLGIEGTHLKTDVKIELLKIPQTEEDRKVIGNEQLKREFMWAAKIGDADTVRKLLKKGLDPNLTTKDLRGISNLKFNPAIMLAAASGDGETVELFLKAGVNVQADKYDYLSKILLSYLGGEPFSRKKPQTMEQFESGARSLIRANANVFALTYDDETSLMIAAENHYSQIVQLLIDKGLDVNAVDENGETALMHAFYSKDKPTASPLETVKVLLKSGANPNIINEPTNARRTALQYAATEGWLEVIDVLVAAKADINLADETGETALTKAIWFQQVKSVKKLLELGVNVKGKQGQLALAKARESALKYRDLANRGSGFKTEANDYEEIVRILEAAGAK